MKTKAQRKARRKKILSKLKKGEHFLAKISLFASRGVFLGALNINMFKLAKRLNQLWEKSPEAVSKFWENFGGETKALRKAVDKGLKHMKKHDAKKEGKKKSKIGYEPVSIATVAAAIPVIISVTKLFVTHKSDKKGDSEADQDALLAMKKSIADGTAANVKTVIADPAGNVKKVLSDSTNTADKPKEEKNNMPKIIGAVAAVGIAGYFLIKKK